MNLISTRSTRVRSGKRLAMIAFAIAALVAALSANVGVAQAAKVTTAPKPTALNAYVVRPDVVLGLLSPASTYNQSQLVSGPNTSGSPVVLSTGGNVIFDNLQPNSTYSFIVRNVKPGSTSSAWVTHTFTTAATYASRPAAPTNLRVSATTATTVSVTWDAPDASSYTYKPTVNGTRVDVDCSVYCTDVDRRTATFSKPAPGTSIVFTVSARDTNFNLSLPVQLVVTD
jgi:hypothetical protein